MSDLSYPIQLAVAPAISLLLVLLLGRPMIAWLKKLGAGQRVRDDGPQRHMQKEGTPTMGGVLIAGAAIVASVPAIGVLNVSSSVSPWLSGATMVGAMVGFGAIGFADDYLKVARGRSLGLKARHKLLLQFIVAAGVMYAVARIRGEAALDLDKPWMHTDKLYRLWILVWALALVGTSNAVNLADGLDGLASGLCAIAAACFAVVGLANGQAAVALISLAIAGACVGFLWYNRHPARVFMGDVGSLALGGALATGVVWLTPSGLAVLVPLAVLAGICFVPFAEAASVVIQVIAFQTTGRRVFKMSPIHHHFELMGWPEQKVVHTFWAVGALVAAATVWMHLR